MVSCFAIYINNVATLTELNQTTPAVERSLHGTLVCSNFHKHRFMIFVG